MNARVGTQFRVEGRRQRMPLPHQNRIITLRGDYFDALTDAFNFRGANKDHFNGLVEKLAFADGAVDLSSVGIPANGNVESAKAKLFGILDVGGEEDAACASAKGWLDANEVA